MRGKRILLSFFLLASLPGHAQVLARPGWAGSGVAPESWWRRAVFYRLDPTRFQDSDGNGHGDLAGVIQRLDYLQSVGVDAILLDGDFDSNGLDDLIREASVHHLRVVLAMPSGNDQTPRDAQSKTAREWLSAGAAGILVPKPSDTPEANTRYAALVADLAVVLRSFPGERVLLTDPAPLPVNLAPRPVRLNRHGASASPPTPAGAQLVTAAAVPGDGGVVALRAALTSAASLSGNPESNPLLRFGTDPPSASPNAASAAAVLLAFRGAAIFDFGDEIGLDLYPASHGPQTADGSSLPVMQWTPSNRTPAPVERADTTTPAPDPTVFGAYHPYQPMVRNLAGSLPAPARVAVDPNVPPDLPDPDTLPGFTGGTLPDQPIDGPRLNVITEDRDPNSLLNFYRQLIGLHHDNATLRNGSEFVLNHDAEGALVWLRRAPVNSRTVANVLVAANTTDRPLTLSLDSEIESLGMRGGELRPLASHSPQAITGATTAHLVLPPHAVFLGEIYHAGSGPEPATRERHRHSGHRVRR